MSKFLHKYNKKDFINSFADAVERCLSVSSRRLRSPCFNYYDLTRATLSMNGVVGNIYIYVHVHISEDMAICRGPREDVHHVRGRAGGSPASKAMAHSRYRCEITSSAKETFPVVLYRINCPVLVWK